MTAAKVFVEVADRGSLTAAGDALDMSRAMVSRYLADLEAWLGCRLLHRTTRRLSLTAAGEGVLAQCRRMLEIGEEMQSVAARGDDTPRGRIRVTSSVSFASTHLMAALVEYGERHPQASVDLLLVDRAVNLVEEGVDLAIRITRELDPNLVARRLSVCRSVVCASPDYLARHGTPRRAEELAGHNCLGHSYVGRSLWEFERAGGPVAVPVAGRLSANEASVLLEAALAGAGIALQPTYAAAPLIRAGRLVRLLPDHRVPDMGIFGVYASRKQMTPLLRTLLDFLAARFGPEPYWDAESAERRRP